MPAKDKKEQKEKRIIDKTAKDAVNRRKTDNIAPDFSTKDDINTDPFGSWTGVCTDDPCEMPVQDADDL